MLWNVTRRKEGRRLRFLPPPLVCASSLQSATTSPTFFCVLLDLSWNYKQKHLHILILPGSYTKGGTLHTLFMVSHLGESPLLICTSRKTERRGEEEMPEEEKESSKRREGGRTERARADGSIMYLLHSSARRDNTFYGGITLFFFLLAFLDFLNPL